MANETPPDLTFYGSIIDGSNGSGWSDRRVLGKRLRPFCLWHRALLNCLSSPFMHNGDKTLRDVRMAVGICRTQFGNSRITKPGLVPSLIWLRTLLWASWPRRKVQTIAGQPEPLNPMQKAIQRHSDDFLAYAGDYLQQPAYSVVPPESNGSNTRIPRGRPPAELDQVADLIGFGLSEERAWNCPFGLANWYRVMALKVRGVDIDFTDAEEKRFQMSLPEGYRWRHRN